jgi:uncharacterized protein (DUF983 family)
MAWCPLTADYRRPQERLMIVTTNPALPPKAEAPSKPRRVWQGMCRGWAGKCPNCDDGKLFRAYLKIKACDACGHDNTQYPADDAPPYFTILIVGHLVIGPLLFFPFIWQAPTALVVGATLPAVGALTLLLLPRVKGAIVGLMWALNSKGDPSVSE